MKSFSAYDARRLAILLHFVTACAFQPFLPSTSMRHDYSRYLSPSLTDSVTPTDKKGRPRYTHTDTPFISFANSTRTSDADESSRIVVEVNELAHTCNHTQARSFKENMSWYKDEIKNITDEVIQLQYTLNEKDKIICELKSALDVKQVPYSMNVTNDYRSIGEVCGNENNYKSDGMYVVLEESNHSYDNQLDSLVLSVEKLQHMVEEKYPFRQRLGGLVKGISVSTTERNCIVEISDDENTERGQKIERLVEALKVISEMRGNKDKLIMSLAEKERYNSDSCFKSSLEWEEEKYNLTKEREELIQELKLVRHNFMKKEIETQTRALKEIAAEKTVLSKLKKSLTKNIESILIEREDTIRTMKKTIALYEKERSSLRVIMRLGIKKLLSYMGLRHY